MEKMMMIYEDDHDNDDAGVRLIERRETGTPGHRDTGTPGHWDNPWQGDGVVQTSRRHFPLMRMVDMMMKYIGK